MLLPEALPPAELLAAPPPAALLVHSPGPSADLPATLRDWAVALGTRPPPQPEWRREEWLYVVLPPWPSALPPSPEAPALRAAPPRRIP